VGDRSRDPHRRRAAALRTTITIEELAVDCLIGCLDRERQRTQTIRVDLELEVDARDAARHDSLRRTWNYAELCDQVQFVLRAGRFYLLETAGQVLVRTLLLPPAPAESRPRVLAARVSLTKFGVLPGSARPRVDVWAAAEELEFGREDKEWGSVEIIDESRLFGLYRLNVAPGQEIPNHVHRRMREAELVLTEGLVGWRDGAEPTSLEVGTVFEWKLDQPHGYRCVGPEAGSILCMDAPPFSAEDEVVVP